jgi:hypothetical protein
MHVLNLNMDKESVKAGDKSTDLLGTPFSDLSGYSKPDAQSGAGNKTSSENNYLLGIKKNGSKSQP